MTTSKSTFQWSFPLYLPLNSLRLELDRIKALDQKGTAFTDHNLPAHVAGSRLRSRIHRVSGATVPKAEPTQLEVLP